MSNLNRLFLENPEEFRKVVLTDFQIMLVNTFKNNPMMKTAKEMSIILNRKHVTLSTHLKTLCEKGYLTRKRVMDYNRCGEYHYKIYS